MQQSRPTLVLTRLVAYVVMVYGLVIIANALLRQLRAHLGHDIDVLLISVPQIAGLGFMYLGSLLLRRKYNAWMAAMVLFVAIFVLDIFRLWSHPAAADRLGALLPVLIVAVLLLTRGAFQVRSDMRSFAQALRISLVVLLVAFLYGVGGFSLLDDHDFHQEISLPAAVHQTIDQFGLTTNPPVAHTRRARLFLDSLPVISIAALGYVIISLFDPIRMRLVNQSAQRELAAHLLQAYPSDIDDFFKLWPHDKHYFFIRSGDAGLAYHVARGVALVVGDPFGNPKQFGRLLTAFHELCFVNDWRPAYVHITDRHRRVYVNHGLALQKLGEEAVLDLEAARAAQKGKKGKYFREIRNRFTRLGYTVALLEPPYDAQLMTRLKALSDDWLTKPGRAERGLMMGYFTPEYMQHSRLAVVRDQAGVVQGFMNLVPTYITGAVNYDMLRCSGDAPGNCNDFLLLSTIDLLREAGWKTLNLGLCPLVGLDDEAETASLIDSALRFVYANGDRFYSFSGLQRFKAKYNPNWEDRFIAYSGGITGFARAMNALTRAMKIK